MAESADNSSISRQVEMIVRKLNALSTLPEVMAGFLSHLTHGKFDVSAASEIISSDPALTAKIYSIVYKEGILSPEDKPTITEAIEKLTPAVIRDEILSLKIFQAFEQDYDPDSKRVLPRKQLGLHALAVACCARRIAELLLPDRAGEMAFTAGLLHDIGKLAIDEVMPKSFERIVAQAKDRNCAINIIERENLGLDHTVIGKRLAEQWNLPEEIVFAIWLHHSDTEMIAENLSAGRLAQVVRLADIIARQCDIGMSGSFNTPDSITEIAESLSLSADQIEKIRSNLRPEVSERSGLLGLETSGASAAYCDLVHDTAVKFAHDNTQLEAANKELAIASAQMIFIKEFLLTVRSNMSAVDAAIAFAGGWQKHYQTGPVCLYIRPDSQVPILDAVIVKDSGRINTKVLKLPNDTPLLPVELQKKFGILNAQDSAEWVFEQIDIECNNSKTRIVPLLSNGRAVGALIFEHRMPLDPAEKLSLFEVSTRIGASVIDLAMTSQRHSRLAEQFAQLLARLKTAGDQLASVRTLEGLAEMAAGAAHELNNPLAVISGRAQLLFDSETDDNKKQMLGQIQDRAGEISEIVADLMSFARPTEAEPKLNSVRILIDEAITRTCEKHKIKKMEVEFSQVDGLGEVNVDKTQAVTAIANVLSNALDSYKGGNGPVRIDGGCEQIETTAAFQIVDTGAGMDTRTLQKATQPFFSVRDAGRKRGMGLAHAQRLLRINNGSIKLASAPGEGTSVTIRLPRE